MFNYYRFDRFEDGTIPIVLAVEDGSFVIMWRLKGENKERIREVIEQLIDVFEENVVFEDGKIMKPETNIEVDTDREWTDEEMLRMMKDEWGGLMK